MDEIEQRLTDALALEAASIAPADATWTGRWIRGPRRAWTITLAAAAVVAIIVGIGLTVRGSKTQQAFGTGSSRTPDCTGGWTSNGSRVIQKSGTTTSVGLTAVTFFAGGTPPAASLCALTIGADQKTTANGGTVSDGSALGYLSSMTAKTGEKSYLIGAFAAPTSRVTFTDEALGWTLSIDATTAGLNDLGNGWYGYVVLAPAVKADITVQAYAFNTAVIDERQVTVGDGSNPAVASDIPSPAKTVGG